METFTHADNQVLLILMKVWLFGSDARFAGESTEQSVGLRGNLFSQHNHRGSLSLRTIWNQCRQPNTLIKAADCSGGVLTAAPACVDVINWYDDGDAVFSLLSSIEWEEKRSLCRNLRGHRSVVGKWSGLVWKHGCSFTNVMLLSALHHCFSAGSSPSVSLSPPPSSGSLLSYAALYWHGNKGEGCQDNRQVTPSQGVEVCVCGGGGGKTLLGTPNSTFHTLHLSQTHVSTCLGHFLAHKVHAEDQSLWHTQCSAVL